MSFLPNLAGINYVPGPNPSTDPNTSAATAPTAQTSGFVQAGAGDSQIEPGTLSRDGGGLQSSPLVPKPGTSTNPQTGNLHSEGITKEELQARKAAEAAAVTAQLSSSTSAELNDQVHPTGGLGTSPLVPKAGTSINPQTGNLHSEGITKEELQAKKAAEAAAITATVSPATSAKPDGLSQDELKHIQEKGKELLDPTPHHQQARRGSSPVAPTSALPPVSETHATALTTDGRRLSDLTGREQAARQLAGNAIPINVRQDSGLSTPGQELPGGWGSTKQTPLPGTGPNAPTSIYNDIAEGLDSVGRAAYNVIPTPIKDAFSASPSSPKSPASAQLGVSPPQGRRSSVTALFDQAKNQASRLVGEAQGTLQNTQRRASASLNKDSEFRNKISDFVDNFAAASPTFVPAGPGRPATVAIVPRYSLPSEEPAGALPGEHTSGAGALPGTSNETGVAVLPDEKKASTSAPRENQGVLPGENSGGIGAILGQLGQSGTAGPSGTSGLAEPSTPTTLSTSSATAGPSGTSAASGSTTTTESAPRAASSGLSWAGLAPALPATSLGSGGDKGATDVPAALGTSSSSANAEPKSLVAAPESTSTVESGSTPATSTLSPATAAATGNSGGIDSTSTSPTGSTGGSSPLAVPETRHGNERTNSSASVTAIRHGHEGSVSKISPLANDGITVPEHEELDTSSIGGQKSTTPGTGPSHTTSLTPGNEHEGIGHPSTRGLEGTEREPGSYPKHDHTAAAAATPATAAGTNKVEEEKRKAENIVDAPAQSSDVSKPTTKEPSKEVGTQPASNGPTTSTEPRKSVDTPSKSTTNTEPVPHPTSVEEAKDIAGVNKTPDSTSSPATKATPPAPATKTTPSSSPSPSTPTKDTAGHSRHASTSSEKKRGLFGKIKDKLKH
ncbi:hypothetical protein I302_108015 [Kwoniella bestiolae CBS 10118]|uniref:Uncharacterized protein n=1 Tax=Kwoniella bestiolae CBS 10118 TaxID=1296100 RepID=A0A1B9FWW5_9TREE|nr:hypothetical protein I302_07620 [Kwoniella bestiolae CBS 10118]OCF23266.1 hypothetical protein I302_07620 [Kwoniella bestiolae CBS 10118]